MKNPGAWPGIFVYRSKFRGLGDTILALLKHETTVIGGRVLTSSYFSLICEISQVKRVVAGGKGPSYTTLHGHVCPWENCTEFVRKIYTCYFLCCIYAMCCRIAAVGTLSVSGQSNSTSYPPKLLCWVVNRRFQAIRRTLNLHNKIIKITAAIPINFCTTIKTTKFSLWVVSMCVR